MKERGILLPIFSLPSKYGIGDFGNEAYEFIDILSENGMNYWEILPINACNRLPYSPLSYYALEEDYISLDKLKESGLIELEEINEKICRHINDLSFGPLHGILHRSKGDGGKWNFGSSWNRGKCSSGRSKGSC